MSDYEDPEYDEIERLIDTDPIELGRRCRAAEFRVAELEKELSDLRWKLYPESMGR